jgi:hypothetical protein
VRLIYNNYSSLAREAQDRRLQKSCQQMKIVMVAAGTDAVKFKGLNGKRKMGEVVTYEWKHHFASGVDELAKQKNLTANA